MLISTLKRGYHLILLVSLAALLSACQLTFPETPSASQANNLYQQLLNRPVPSQISHLEMDADSMEAGLWTAVYLRYTASPAYFDLLAKHTAFAQASEFNTPIAPVSCTSPQMPADFRYWTDQPIELAGKQCYLGVYFPYNHYLVYEPETQHVDHFVAGMSE